MKKVAIVGVEGSGKTVMLAGLGDLYTYPDGEGYFLSPKNFSTAAYVAEKIERMRKGEWPAATAGDEMQGLNWTLRQRKPGSRGRPDDICEVSFLDFAGEVYRTAFGIRDGDASHAEQADELKRYVSEADDLIVLINLRDVIVHGVRDLRVQEAMWITNEILGTALSEEDGRKPPRAAIVLSQADSYADTIEACGGAAGVLQKYLPHVANNYGWLDVFAASAVDKTKLDDDGNVVPAEDFTSKGLLPIMTWIGGASVVMASAGESCGISPSKTNDGTATGSSDASGSSRHPSPSGYLLQNGPRVGVSKKTVKCMLTAFRDGFQSVLGARVLSKDFLPCVEEAYVAGLRWFEAGGWARFQSCYFYCQEDAFDVMDAFRRAAPEADLQTLSRGVNVVGLESQPSDMIKLHAQMFKKHGMSSIRNFDALNDVNNLKWSGQCIHDAGLNHEVVVTMMGLPPGIDNKGTHTPEFYRDRLKMIMDAGIPFDHVAFKDASGTSAPATVYSTMKLARKLLGDEVHIQFHTHDTAGNGALCYMAALYGGADGLDLSMAPLSGGNCQPDIIAMCHSLDGNSDFCFDFDINKVKKAEDSFVHAMRKYYLPPEARIINPQIVWSPMPGGALTANTQMLRDNNMMDKYDDMIAEMYDCMRLGGFGTSVTPVSQFYAQQAIQNAIFGKFKKFAPGYAKMVLGYFGKTPVPPDPEIVKKASEFMAANELTRAYSQPTTKTVLEMNDADPKKGGVVARKMLEDARLPITDENIFIAASCKEKGILFLKDPSKAPMGCRFAETSPSGMALHATANSGIKVRAPVPGKVLRITAAAGAKVSRGDEILVMDVMKMEVPVTAPCTGMVTINVNPTDKVATGDVLAVIT